MQRFGAFWQLVAECLKPDGRVVFLDDAYRATDELIHGEQSEVIRRTLNDGTAFKAVKVPHTPAQLEQQLRALGWVIRVRYLIDPSSGAPVADNGVPPVSRTPEAFVETGGTPPPTA